MTSKIAEKTETGTVTRELIKLLKDKSLRSVVFIKSARQSQFEDADFFLRLCFESKSKISGETLSEHYEFPVFGRIDNLALEYTVPDRYKDIEAFCSDTVKWAGFGQLGWIHFLKPGDCLNIYFWHGKKSENPGYHFITDKCYLQVIRKGKPFFFLIGCFVGPNNLARFVRK